MQATAIPYCGAPPVPADLAARWNFDPVLIAAVAAALLICRLRGARAVPLATGGALALLLFVSPLCALGSALFAMRVTHHVALTVLVAPLLALAMPGGGQRLATWTVAQAAVLWVWHAPPAYGLTLTNDAAYGLMQLSLLGTALSFWRAALAAPPLAAIAALLATMVQMGLLGALLTFASRPLYDWHLATTQAWGLAPAADQQLGGLIMWVPGAALYLAAALRLANAWLAKRQHRPAGA